MKNSTRFLHLGGLAVVLLILPFFLSAQEPQEPKQEKEKKTVTFDPYWMINVNGGVLLYHGDIAGPSDKGAIFPDTENWKLGYGVMLGRQFSPVFGLRLAYLGGKLAGTKTTEDDDEIRFTDVFYNWAYESDKFHNPNLNATLNLSNLFGGYNPDRVVSFKVMAGAGVVFTKGVLTDYDTGEEITFAGLPEAAQNVIGDDLKEPDTDVTTYNIPLGVGIDFRLTQKLDLNLESVFSFTGSDEFDRYVDDAMPVKTDMFSYTSLGLTYKFVSAGNLDKMVKDYGLVKYEVTPDPMVNTCTDIPVTIKGTFPENYFNKKAAIQFAPVLKWEGGSYQLDPIYLQGENVIGDGKVIPYAEGGSFTYTATIPYQEGMEASDLVVDPVAFLVKSNTLEPTTRELILEGYKSAVLGERKLADGVIMPKKVMHDEELLYADCPTSQKVGLDCKEYYEKETILIKEAIIWFKVNMHDLNWNLPLNKDPQAIAKLNEFKEFLAQGYKIKEIDVDAWASPEGEESWNEGLSERRSKTGHNYLIDLFKKMSKEKDTKVMFADPAQEIKFNVRAHGEDWDGFMKAVEASTIKDKNVILNVVRSQPDVMKREQEIRNMALVYKEIEESILPPLRRTQMKVHVFEPKRTDEEIAQLAMTDPATLTDKELLYAATLTDNMDTKEQILKKYVELYPNDWKGHNNLGWIYLKKGNTEEGGKHIQKANELRGNHPIILNNMGAYYSKIGEYTKAETYYTEAKNLGAPVNYNMGIVQAATCKYDQAAASFGGSKCTYNVALVKFQKGDYQGAGTELNCAEPSSAVHYLKAVIGARTDNSQMLFENLTKAVQESEKCKTKAAADREFVKYYADPNFQALIK